MSWAAPYDGGLAINKYEIRVYVKANGWDSGSTYKVEGTPPAPTYTIEGLTNGTEYVVRVRAYNPIGGSACWTDDVYGIPFPGSAPELPDAGKAHTASDNTAIGVTIGAPYAATDDDSDLLTYSLGGANAASFSIGETSGQLAAAEVLSYETQNVYNLTVIAADGTGGFGSIAVTVPDEAKAGTVSIAPASPKIVTALTATLHDEDGGLVEIGWVWASSSDWNPGAKTGNWKNISGASGESYTPKSDDLSKYLRVTRRYLDKHTSGIVEVREVTSSVVVKADGANTAPVFDETGAVTRSVAENTDARQNIGAAESATDDDELTYSLGGTDAESFAIDSSNGQLKTKAALDHETKAPYAVTVSVIDVTDTASLNVTINLGDANDPGVVTFDSTSATVVVALAASLSDQDGGATAVIWQWAWDYSPGGTLTNVIDGATSASYTPRTAHANNYLQVTAAYTDDYGSGQTASLVTANTIVAAATPRQHRAVLHRWRQHDPLRGGEHRRRRGHWRRHRRH